MENSSRKVGDLNKEEWENLILTVDSQIPNPEQRAERVREILGPVIRDTEQHEAITNWDMICFCLSFLATQFTEYPSILRVIKTLNKFIYQMHYQQTREIGLLKE